MFPEPCPIPTEVIVEGCHDSAHVQLPDVNMQGLGRIVQVDATVKSVCPGKRIAVSVILMETDADGKEYPVGAKHMLIPAHTEAACQDVTLKCIPFSVPEALDVTGSPTSICEARSFNVRVIANYVDTDFACCDAQAQIV